MKNVLLFLVLILGFTSCNSGKKYQGTWILDIFNPSNDEFNNPVENIFIENDSIKFNYSSFNHWHKFPLKIEHDKLLFNNWDINVDVIEDTLLLQNNFYLKDENDSKLKMWYRKPITRVNLPKTPSINFNKKESIKNNQPNYYILFGKPNNKDEYRLQLNDKHTEISSLAMFINSEKAGFREELIPFANAVLFIDKSSPMKFIEDVFYNLTIANQMKVSLVNNIILNYNDSIGLHYKYELLNKKLPYLHKDDNYIANTSKTYIPKPPPPHFKMFDDENLESKFILLKENKIYFNNKIILPSQLKSIIKPWIENNNVIFSLYDLESTYESFLEMIAIINSIYQDVREKDSKIKFNKHLDDLSREELFEIKSNTPMRHIWSYSILHYNSVIENSNSFFGLNVKAIKKTAIQ